MKKIIALLLISAAVGVTMFGSTLTAAPAVAGEWNLEALYNGDGTFRGCWANPNDCKKVIVAQPEEPTTL